ncbi:FecR family protein [Flavobacterium sp. W22_SRS_FP1]|uniref:FecR family protein n=1 Tax=Flavobacterium sp. W22_SRS_FP1 TaxID=3240276 RepID=UPI003F90FF39
MSKGERSVFEIELSLDDNLLAIFKNFQTIWISYPNSEFPKKTVSFEDLINRSNKPQRLQLKKASIKKILVFSVAVLVVFGIGSLFIRVPQSEYTNQRIAGKGQRLSIILPDSSTVILNSGSKVKYSSDFGKERAIWLEGEAFFKVTKNTKSPFIVHTNDFDVKVLGTEFNINSTTLNQTVSLAKGKVNVLLKESTDEINLLPNEELVWNAKTKAIIKRNFDISKALAWKENILLLDDMKIEDAISKINLFYGVNFVIKDSAIAKQHIKGAFKDQTIDEFITSLEFISDVSITRTSKNNMEITKHNEN